MTANELGETGQNPRPSRNNPFNVKTHSLQYHAFDEGYTEAVAYWKEQDATWRDEYKSQQAEGFIGALYLLAQEYGGERFVYTGDNQEEMEAFSDRIKEANDELTTLLSHIRTLR